MKKYNIFLIIFLFFMIYYPPLLKINFLHISGLISWIYILFHIKTINKNKSFKKVKEVYFLFAFLLIYMIIITLINQNSRQIIAMFLYWMLDIIPACIVTLDVCANKNYKEIDLINILLIVGNIQGILSVFAFIFPSFKFAFMDRMISNGFEDVYLQLAQFRMYGVSSNLTYSTPIVQSMFGMIAVYLSITKNIKYLFFVPLTIFSAVINARTSFIIIIVGFIAILLSPNKRQATKAVKIVVIVCLSLVLFRLIMFFLQTYAQETYTWVDTGFKEITNFINGENTGYFTYVTNDQKYLTPSGIDFVFGKGIRSLGETKYGIASDVGWINDIWMGGIIYSIIIYAFFIKMLIRIYFCNNELKLINKFLAIFFFGAFFVGNFKGYIISSNEFMTLVFLIVFYIKNEK